MFNKQNARMVPILVVQDDGRYRIVAGERRYRADKP